MELLIFSPAQIPNRDRGSSMAKGATEQEKLRQATARLWRTKHYEQVMHNVSKTCRFFGVSRRQFYYVAEAVS
jgi:hypothetical protein